MEISLATIADSANVSREGKLNLSGIYDTIRATGFPAIHPIIVLAFRLRVTDEDSQKTVRIGIQLVHGESNMPLWTTSADLEVGTIPLGEIQHFDQIVQLVGVKFEEPGRYGFQIQLSGDRRCQEIPLRVVKSE
jgi:hypothetical protein